MLILVEVLFLVFGIIFNINSLLITTLVLSLFYLGITFYGISIGCTQCKGFKLVFLIRIICFALSIIFLCI